MRFFQLKIYTDAEGIETATAILSAIGYDNIIIENGKDIDELLQEKHLYGWDYVDESVAALKDAQPNVTLYVQTDSEVHAIRQALTGYDIEIETVDDDEWKDKWKEYFKPTRVTDRIVIKPTWEEYAAKQEIVIEIDPGMAFGTGTHPTTAMCIRLLEKYIKPGKKSEKQGIAQNMRDGTGKMTVLDVGSGSGILSIAACLLGAEQVTAVDIDPLAVKITRENAVLNKVEGKIDIREGDITKSLFTFQSQFLQNSQPLKVNIVVANLMAELIVRLSADVKKHLCGGGIFISSGILLEKQEIVKEALLENGFQLIDILTEGEWCAIAARIEREKISHE